MSEVMIGNYSDNISKDSLNSVPQDEERSVELGIRFWLEGVLLPVIGVVGIFGRLNKYKLCSCSAFGYLK